MAPEPARGRARGCSPHVPSPLGLQEGGGCPQNPPPGLQVQVWMTGVGFPGGSVATMPRTPSLARPAHSCLPSNTGSNEAHRGLPQTGARPRSRCSQETLWMLTSVASVWPALNGASQETFTRNCPSLSPQPARGSPIIDHHPCASCLAPFLSSPDPGAPRPDSSG